MARLKATDVVGKSSAAGIKVSSVTNYIPNTTPMLSRGVISSAKGMIPDISKVGYIKLILQLLQKMIVN